MQALRYDERSRVRHHVPRRQVLVGGWYTRDPSLIAIAPALK